MKLSVTRTSLLALAFVTIPALALAIGQNSYIETIPRVGTFPLVQTGTAARLVVDASDWPGVTRAAKDLQADVNRVTGITPTLATSITGVTGDVVIIGTIGRSALIDSLVRDKKLDVSGIAGKWESFILQTVLNPLPGVARAVVIAGSDKRGTIFGVYDLSEQIGVSPWYWWQDVTPDRKTALFIKPGRYQQGEP